MAEKERKCDLPEEFKRLNTSAEGLTSAEAASRLSQYGYNELAEKKESKWKKLIHAFWGPIPWMIEIAAILSLVIRHWDDFAIITFMLVLNAIIEFVQSSKAADALDALKASMALKARTRRDGNWTEIPARELVPGDIVHLSNGDIIPADIILAKGEYLSIDQAALTGESLPVNRMVGSEAYSGSIVKQGDMVCLVEKTGKDTFFGRTASLVQSAGNVSHFQKSVLNIGRFLIVGALFLAMLIIAKELYVHENPLALIQLVLVLVVASIPVAMPAVLSVTMALGALALSKKKAIVSKLEAIEEMAAVDILCSDKTGTLTKNELKLYDSILFTAKSEEELRLLGALASNLEGKDAIDKVIVASASEKLQQYKQVKFSPFDPVGKKTEADIEFAGKTFKVMKGAPQVIIDKCAEDEATKAKATKEVEDLAYKGLRSLGVACTDDSGNLRLMGILSLYDPPRDDSKSTIDEAHAYGIDVKMVTGDDLAIGREISRQLGLGTNLKAAAQMFKGVTDVEMVPNRIKEEIIHSDGFARVFPEHKYAIVKAFQDKGYVAAMTGDGVNDAPALKQADVGIAVSGATDAARAAADLILTEPGLSVITHAVEEARKIFRRMISYVIYRVAMTIDIMVFVTAAILFLNFSPLNAIMIILLALLDDIPIMAIAYDNTEADEKPVKWDLGNVLTLSTVLGLLSVIQSFGLMHLARRFFPGDDIQTTIFLGLVVGGHLLLFVARHKGWFFVKPFPSAKLITAIFSTQIVAVLLCYFGLFVSKISVENIVFVWLYCIAWMFILNVFSVTLNKYRFWKIK